DLVVEAKERYVRFFDPASAYWGGKPASAEVLKDLRGHLEDLGKHYQARGQKKRDAGSEDPKPDFEASVRWYQRLLDLFPTDPKLAETRFLMADALLDGGKVVEAAQQYTKVASTPG